MTKCVRTKILISLSSPELVADPYTATHGLYSAVTPDTKTANMLSALAKSMGFDVDATKFHVTVMYSKDNSPEGAGCDGEKVYYARAVRLQHWPGHDAKGYLTLALVSEELTAEHDRLKALGCKADFEYNPHVTIWSGIEMSADLQAKIDKFTAKVSKWPVLAFGKQFVGDMKD